MPNSHGIAPMKLLIGMGIVYIGKNHGLTNTFSFTNSHEDSGQCFISPFTTPKPSEDVFLYYYFAYKIVTSIMG